MNCRLNFVPILLLGMIPLLSHAADGDNSGNTTTDTNSNDTPSTPDTAAVIQQQKQQLVQQFMTQLLTASPDDKVGLIGSFQQQLNTLLAPLQPPPLTQDQKIVQVTNEQATLQIQMQTLPAEQQQAMAAHLQHQQMVLQLACAATAEDRLAIITQFHQAVTQQEQTLNAQSATSAGSTSQTTIGLPNAAGLLASLPSEQQAQMAMKLQRDQALQAALLLPPDERAIALQALPILTPPDASTATSANSTTTSSSNP